VPNAEPYTNGLFYPSGKIYIAAKDMLDPEKFLEVYSVMAHELCHFAIFLLYGNNAKPYKDNQPEIEANFDQITENCEELSQCQEIVDSVFECYPEEMFHAELIVRVPQMIVIYFYDQIFTNLMRGTFFRLFDFYEVNVVTEMERELPNLQQKFSRNKKEEKLKLWIKVLIAFVCFLIPIGLAAIIYVYSPTYSWSKLSNEKQMKFKNATVNFYGVNVRFGDLFSNNSEVFDLLSSEQIKFGLENNSEELSRALHSTYSHKIFLHYSNMTESLKENFVGRQVNFQGQKVKIEEILRNFKVLNFLTCSEVRKTFEGHPINISSQTEAKTNFFIERHFIHEEIKIESSGHYKNGEINKENPDVKNFSRILLEVKKSKIFILSSVAGEGKSSTFRNFALKLKEENPQNWIQFVDLKKHFEAYKKGSETDLKKSEEVLNFLTSNLLNLNKFESEIFRELYGSNRVTFLWDGIDEISPLYKDFMLKLTSTIKSSSKNFQFISTRPQFSKDFREKLKVKAHKLIPLGKSSRFEFLIKEIAVNFNKSSEEFWEKVLKVSQGNFDNFLSMKNSSKFYEENLKLFSLIEKAQKILDSLDKSENLITNPLLLRMISEILSDENLDENSDLNFYNIYETFIDKKLEIVHKKGKIAEKEIDKVVKKGLGVMQVHQAFAIKQIFQAFQKEANFSILNLEIMKTIKKLSSFEISRLGILNVNFESDFTFVHQTFAEFLVARFLIDNFEDFDFKNEATDSDLKIYLLNLVLFSRKFEFTKNILLSFAKIQNETPKFFEALRKDEDFYKVFRNFSTFQNFKTNFMQSEKIKTVNVFVKFHRVKNEVEKSFEENPEIKKMLLSKNNESWTLLHEVVRYDENENFIESFLIKTQEFLNKTEISSLIFTQESKYDETSLMFAAKFKKLKDLKLFWNFLDNNLNEEEKGKILLFESKFLLMKTKSSLTALQHSTWNKDPNSFLFMKEIYEKFFTQEKIREIFKKIDKDYFSFVEFVIYLASPETAHEFSKYLENLFRNKKIELRNILSHRNKFGNSIFSSHSDIKEFEEKLKIFIELFRKTFDENQDDEELLEFENNLIDPR
jgi:hypothetical protein